MGDEMDIRNHMGCAVARTIGFNVSAREGALDESFLIRGWFAPFVSVGGTPGRTQTFCYAGIDGGGE